MNAVTNLGIRCMKINSFRVALAALAVAVGGLSSASATPVLMLSTDGGDNWTREDHQSAPGEIFALTTKDYWFLKVTAQTHPAVGSESEPVMNLNNVRFSSADGGIALIRFYETDFSLTSYNGQWESKVLNGAMNAWQMMSVTAYLDPNNGAFDGAIPGTASNISAGCAHSTTRSVPA